MIQANELRIGNKIKFNNYLEKERIVTVNARFFSSLAGGRSTEEMKPDEEINNYYSGIPLTPEILDKCGLMGGGMFPAIEYFTLESGSLFFEGYYTTVDIKYLHQLQNLYFALTGEELEVKL